MIVDLYAGPGGWDLGARWLGVEDVIGFEHSHDENRTAIAAGFSRVECDVSAYPLDQFPEVEGLIAFPVGFGIVDGDGELHGDAPSVRGVA